MEIAHVSPFFESQMERRVWFCVCRSAPAWLQLSAHLGRQGAVSSAGIAATTASQCLYTTYRIPTLHIIHISVGMYVYVQRVPMHYQCKMAACIGGRKAWSVGVCSTPLSPNEGVRIRAETAKRLGRWAPCLQPPSTDGAWHVS